MDRVTRYMCLWKVASAPEISRGERNLPVELVEVSSDISLVAVIGLVYFSRFLARE